jgi:iron complex transport system substrate-binding protein
MRIISLLSSATEILFALGLGEQVHAVSHDCDFPPAALGLPKATRSHIDSSLSSGRIDQQVAELAHSNGALFEINASLIAELRPDLIVTQAQCDVCAVRYEDVVRLVRTEPALAGTKVLALQPQSLEDVFADIERVGEAAGASGAAREYTRSLLARVERVQQITAAISAPLRPRVVCLEWLDPLMAAGNWTPQLVAWAGGESGLAIAGRHSDYVSPEAVLQFDPDVLIVAPCGFDLERTIGEARSLQFWQWDRLSACQRGRVYALDGNAYLNRSGPRLVDSLEILAHLLHPERAPVPACAIGSPPPWARFALRGGRMFPA